MIPFSFKNCTPWLYPQTPICNDLTRAHKTYTEHYLRLLTSLISEIPVPQTIASLIVRWVQQQYFLTICCHIPSKLFTTKILAIIVNLSRTLIFNTTGLYVIYTNYKNTLDAVKDLFEKFFDSYNKKIVC